MSITFKVGKVRVGESQNLVNSSFFGVQNCENRTFYLLNFILKSRSIVAIIRGIYTRGTQVVLLFCLLMGTLLTELRSTRASPFKDALDALHNAAELLLS